MKEIKFLFQFQLATKNFEKTCPQCNRHEGFVLKQPLFRESSRDWDLICGWEEAKDKNIYSRFL